MKYLILTFICILMLSSSASSQWITIDSARAQDSAGVSLLLTQSITTRGVVTTHREFGGSLVYFQVNTAGFVGFDTAFCNRVKRGDSIEVTGVVTQFSGLTELTPMTALTIFDTGKTVTPKPVTCTQIRNNGEAYEGMLIKISGVTAVRTFAGADITTWTVSGSGVNYRIFTGSDSCDIRIYATTNIANQPVHSFPFDVVAECSQFKFSSPFIGGYQILPRDLNDFSGVTGAGTVSSVIPDKFSLDQNYPNPFNPNTVIRYSLNENSFVSLKIYNVLGREVKSLVNETRPAGIYDVEFDGSNLSSGIYLYTLNADGITETKRMILLK